MNCGSLRCTRNAIRLAVRLYGDATVKRMKQIFNAPLNDAAMAEIVDHLVKTYGNEQSK